MRQFIIFQRQPHGAVFVKLPDYFKVEISIKNDMVLLDFMDGKNNETIFVSFYFSDNDEH